MDGSATIVDCRSLWSQIVIAVMSRFLKLLNKPEYLYQPGALARRIFSLKPVGNGSRIVKLPWKLTLEVNPAEAVGRAIAHHGLFEVAVVETIFRLAESTDTFLDVGANIGFMSAVAISAGVKQVISFEPHPALFERLSRNLGMWIDAKPEIAGRIQLKQVAISESEGKACLRIPKHDFSTNQGTSSLELREEESDMGIETMTTTLDRVVEGCHEPIGVLKIDVEGHEIKAFTGGRESLKAGKVRDIIFEDHEGVTSEVSRMLAAFGYSIFGLNKTLLGPVLLASAASVKRFQGISDEPLNFLATLNPARATLRMSRSGYECLGQLRHPR
jgi:FkbM family methyltransferase